MHTYIIISKKSKQNLQMNAMAEDSLKIINIILEIIWKNNHNQPSE